MKILLTVLILCLSTSVFSDVFVNGYTRSDGTYVAPHYRSSPNYTNFARPRSIESTLDPNATSDAILAARKRGADNRGLFRLIFGKNVIEK